MYIQVIIAVNVFKFSHSRFRFYVHSCVRNLVIWRSRVGKKEVFRRIIGVTIVKGAGGTADKLVRQSTFFKARLTLSERHWEMIMESAGSFINKKKLQKCLPEPAVVLEDSPEHQQQYNEALHDPMFD